MKQKEFLKINIEKININKSIKYGDMIVIQNDELTKYCINLERKTVLEIIATNNSEKEDY